MLEVKVVLFGFSPCSCCAHIEAQIRDMETDQKFCISYQTYRTPEQLAADLSKILTSPDCCIHDIVTLYSNEMTLDKFKEEYNKKFVAGSYNFCCNNCADAVQFISDTLFPKKTCQNITYNAYKLLCCSAFFATLGGSCFPSVLCTTPHDVFRKAKLLRWTYGNNPSEESEKLIGMDAVKKDSSDKDAKVVDQSVAAQTATPIVPPASPAALRG